MSFKASVLPSCSRAIITGTKIVGSRNRIHSEWLKMYNASAYVRNQDFEAAVVGRTHDKYDVFLLKRNLLPLEFYVEAELYRRLLLRKEMHLCNICLGYIEENYSWDCTRSTLSRPSSCFHTFCRSCLEKWFVEHHSCPVCRLDSHAIICLEYDEACFTKPKLLSLVQKIVRQIIKDDKAARKISILSLVKNEIMFYDVMKKAKFLSPF